MNEKDESGDRSDVHRIWIGEADRIASFHPVDEYRLQTVSGYEDYVEFLQALQEQGFRFQ